MGKDIVNCYCTELEEDGLMIQCESCKTWQHAMCVNIAPKLSGLFRHVCPRCKDVLLNCPCLIEEYGLRMIDCCICGRSYHKRHIRLGIGENPRNFKCFHCMIDEDYKCSKDCDDLLYNFTVPKHSISKFNRLYIPREIKITENGSFYSDIFNAFKKPSTIVDFVTYFYKRYKGNIFGNHPFLENFSFCKDNDRRDSSEFCKEFIDNTSYIFDIKRSETVMVLEHVISYDIYKTDVPLYFREDISNFKYYFLDEAEISKSERVDDIFISLKNIPSYVEQKIPRVTLLKNKSGYETVVAFDEIRSGDLIMPIIGDGFHLEELDSYDRVPNHEWYSTDVQSVFIDCSRLSKRPLFTRIRRGFVSNCIVRLFKYKDQIKAGIFATEPVALPNLREYLSLRLRLSIHSIKGGEELVLPFDIPPMVIPPPEDWCGKDVKKPRLTDCNCLVDKEQLFGKIKKFYPERVTKYRLLNEVGKPVGLFQNLSSDKTFISIKLKNEGFIRNNDTEAKDDIKSDLSCFRDFSDEYKGPKETVEPVYVLNEPSTISSNSFWRALENKYFSDYK